jgi:hypothetical protein
MQIKPEFEIVDEFAKHAKGLKNKYPEIFDGIDVDKLKCVSITNKERSQGKKKLWTVLPVKQPIRMDCPFSHYIIMFASDWEELNDKMRLLLVADVLQSIPTDDDEGKTISPDMHEFAVMVRTFGADFMDNEKVPHLLDDKVDWKR